MPLIMHHYPVKSWEHFQLKIAKWHFGLVKEDFDKYVEYSNRIWDNSMEEFVKDVERVVRNSRAGHLVLSEGEKEELEVLGEKFEIKGERYGGEHEKLLNA